VTVRDAILLSVPVFAARGGLGPATVRGALERAGVSAATAAEIVEFLPLALARAMLEGMGIRFADYYVRQTAQGQVIGQKLLADEPVYREGLLVANEVSATDESAFLAVAGHSPEFRAIRRALQNGAAAEDLRCAPPIVLAHDEDPRTFDDISGAPPPRLRAWWRFWK
jgi:hypothetical protein